MKNLNLVLRTDITDQDVLGNISEECQAVLINEDNFWIEVLPKGFGVNDGWNLKETDSIVEAVEILKNFIFLESVAQNS